MPRAPRLRIALLLAACCLAALLAAARPRGVAESTMTTTMGATNVTPMWGPQIPKLVYDGSGGWYYAATFDGNGTQFPWTARIWKSRDGESWTAVKRFDARLRQPPGLLVDSGNRLWLIATCEPGAECYPGVPAAPNRYALRLQFASRLPDGSVDFDAWRDFSSRTAELGDRLYTGMAIDRDRRFVYQAYSNTAYSFYLSRFDTWTGTDSVHFLAQPAAGEGYLYPRVRPGTGKGEVWLLTDQTEVFGANSATKHGVELWRSTDYGQTVASDERFRVAYCPAPDGVTNWCDASDLVIDDFDAPHVLFYKMIDSRPHLYYWGGAPGSVTLRRSPVDLGPYDEHSQLLVRDGERFLLGHVPAPGDNVLRIRRSTDGATWSTTAFPIAGAKRIYSPNLLRPESGTFGWEEPGTFRMLISSEPAAGSFYSHVKFVTYRY